MLAFISRAEGEKDKGQLHILPVQGGTPREVCKMPGGVSELAWSPNGSRIAFLARDGEEPQSDPVVLKPGQGRHRRLWSLRPDSDTPEPVTPDGETAWQYAWIAPSPNARSPASSSFIRAKATA
jgi:Tol biopolymer transport system component